MIEYDTKEVLLFAICASSRERHNEADNSGYYFRILTGRFDFPMVKRLVWEAESIGLFRLAKKMS